MCEKIHAELVSGTLLLLQFPKFLSTLRTFSFFCQLCLPHEYLSYCLLGTPSEVVSQSVPRRWLTCDASEDGVGGGHEGEGDGQ